MVISLKMLGEMVVWQQQNEQGEWVKVKRFVGQPLEGVIYYTSSNPAFIMFTAGKILSRYKGMLPDIENWQDLPKYQQNLLKDAWRITAPMFQPGLGFEPFRKDPAPRIVLVESLAERKHTADPQPVVFSMLTRSKTLSNREGFDFAEFPVEKHNDDPGWVDPADVKEDWYDPIDDWGRRLLPEAQPARSRRFPELPPSPSSPPKPKSKPKATKKRKTTKATVVEEEEDDDSDRSTTPSPPARKKSRKTTTQAAPVATSSKARGKRPAKGR